MEIGRFLAKSSVGNSAPSQTSADKGPAKTQGKGPTKGPQDGNGVTTFADRNASVAPASARLNAPAPQASGAQTALASREVSVGGAATSTRLVPKVRSEANMEVGLRRLIQNGNGLATGITSNAMTERAALSAFAQCNGFSAEEFKAAIEQKCRNTEANAKFTPDLQSWSNRAVGGSFATRARTLGELRLGLNATRAAHTGYIKKRESYREELRADFNLGTEPEDDDRLFAESDLLPAAGDSLLKMHVALSALEKAAGIRPPAPKG
jgi:hypothetical protein